MKNFIYNLQYTGSELDNALSLLDKSWIQVKVKNGIPNEKVTLTPGNSYLLINEVPQYFSGSAYNCKGTELNKELYNTHIMYRQYDLFTISNLNPSSSSAWEKGAANSRFVCPILTKPGHIYYLQVEIDGLNSNGVPHGVALEERSERTTPFSQITKYLQYSTTSLDEEFISLYGVVNSDNTDLGFYANMSATKGESEVHFGQYSLVDLTACFGVGNEPDKLWCDNHINMWTPKNDYQTSIIITERNIKYNDITGTFDNNGECLLSLPGFGAWSAKSKYLDVNTSTEATGCTFQSINTSSLPSGGYAYATINNSNTRYTTGTNIPFQQGDKLHIYMNRGSNNGSSGIYLYRDKKNDSDMPDYYVNSGALTYTWDSSTAPTTFKSVNVTFENEDSNYLNCFIKLKKNASTTLLNLSDLHSVIDVDTVKRYEIEFPRIETYKSNNTHTVYVPVIGSSSEIQVNSAGYVGSFYSINQSSRQFTVNQSINVPISSTGASNAKNNFYITWNSSSGNYSGSTLYKITSATSYSSGGTPVYIKLTVDSMTAQLVNLPNIKIVPIYGPLAAKSFVVYFYEKTNTGLIWKNTTFDIPVYYYIFIKNENDDGTWGWNNYKNYINNNSICIRKGEMSFSEGMSTYVATFDTLPGDNEYVYFSIVAGYDIVDS